MAYIVMVYLVMAYTGMAYVVMAGVSGLSRLKFSISYSHALYSHGLHSHNLYTYSLLILAYVHEHAGKLWPTRAALQARNRSRLPQDFMSLRDVDHPTSYAIIDVLACVRA